MEKIQKISIEKAKREDIYITNILKDFEGGIMTILSTIDAYGQFIRIYKVEKGSTSVIFKTMRCKKADEKCIDRFRKEYRLILRGSELTDGVIKPIACEEATIEGYDEFSVEIAYEYCEQDLSTLIGKIDANETINIMIRVAEIMVILHADGIFHSDLKPSNIAKQGSLVKIIDFGIAMKLEPSEMLETVEIVDGTMLYLPPEAINNNKGCPAKIDVYCWGMTFYQLLAEKDTSSLLDELKLRRADYPKFLNNIKNMKFKGFINKSLKDKLINLLLRVLDIDYKKRPTFSELLPLLIVEDNCAKKSIMQKDYKQISKKHKEELEISKIELKEIIKERDDLKMRCEDLLTQNNKLRRELQNLNEIHKNNKKEIFKLSKMLNEYDKVNKKSISKSKSEYESKLSSQFEEVKSISQKAYEVTKVEYDKMKLGIDSICIYDECIGNAGAYIIADGLSYANNLNHLALGFCAIGVEGAKELAKGLLLCKNLKEVLFGYRTYPDVGQSQAPNFNVKNSNQFKLKGTKAIAKWLESSSVKSLDLSYCNIQKKAMKYLISAVNCCKTLVEICIEQNPEIKEIKYNFRNELCVEGCPL